MKKMKKKRMDHFLVHCTNLFSPYVKKVINGEDCNLLNLSRAIDGIIYQYVGDEDRFLIVTKETRKKRIKCLKRFINEYLGTDWETKKNIAKKIIFKCGFNESVIFNNYLMELPFEVIVKENPYFFYYKEAKSEVEGEGIESDPNSKSEPPELDFQD